MQDSSLSPEQVYDQTWLDQYKQLLTPTKLQTQQ